MSVFQQGVVIQVGIGLILALGYWLAANIGKFSFGHAGFMAIGAYGAGILTVKLGWPLPAAIPLGGLAAGVVGALVGMAALRLSLLYLAIVTLAFATLVATLLTNWSYVGSDVGFNGLAGTTVTMVVVVFAIVLLYTWLVKRSRFGLTQSALREDAYAARASGINTTRLAVTVFAQSAALTGIGGALSAHYLLFITPNMYGPQQSLVIILYVVFGGLETMWGPLAGAGILVLLPVLVTGLQSSYQYIYGGLLILLMIFRPQGIIGRRRENGPDLLRWFRRGEPPLMDPDLAPVALEESRR